MAQTETADAILHKTIKDLLSIIRKQTDETYVIHTTPPVERDHDPQMQLFVPRQSGRDRAVSPPLSPAAMAVYLKGFHDGIHAGYNGGFMAAKRRR